MKELRKCFTNRVYSKEVKEAICNGLMTNAAHWSNVVHPQLRGRINKMRLPSCQSTLAHEHQALNMIQIRYEQTNAAYTIVCLVHFNTMIFSSERFT